MEDKSVIEVWFWGFYYIILLLFFLFNLDNNLTILSKIIIVILLSFITAHFRYEKRFNTSGAVLIAIAGALLAEILNVNLGEFWLLLIIYIIGFYGSCQLFIKGIIPKAK